MKKIFQVLALNIAYLIILLAIISLFSFVVRENLGSMANISDPLAKISQMMAGAIEPDSIILKDMAAVSSSIRWFFATMIAVAILTIIAACLTAGYFKAWIWSKITSIPLKKYAALKLSFLLGLWTLSWLLVSIFLVFTLKFSRDVLIKINLIYFILFAYFSLLLIPVFIRKQQIIGSLKETFRLGTKKFYEFIPAFALIGLVAILSFATAIYLAMIYSPLGLIEIPLFLFFIVWTKYFINNKFTRVCR